MCADLVCACCLRFRMSTLTHSILEDGESIRNPHNYGEQYGRSTMELSKQIAMRNDRPSTREVLKRTRIVTVKA